ncbi:MAG: sulfurtransferase [Proteobacteria bacterium]|nr:sulfurtransferase [Pseudomonadota bacterium]
MAKSEKLVDPQWLEARKGDPGLRLIEVDWTGTEAYATGHIPGAIGWNWKEWLWDPLVRDFPSPEEFAQRCGKAGIANATTVVFYGDPIQFGTYAWWVFNYLDHPDVRILDGGRTRWAKEGRPLTTEIPAVTPTTYKTPRQRREHMRADRDDLIAALAKFHSRKEKVLLDHRSPDEYNGLRVNVPGMPDVGAERTGRIPGAQHLHFNELLNADTSFKTPAELKALFEGSGAAADKDIVSYCRLSHRATLAYFAMTELLGYKNVRVYDGSWTEWGSMVGMPIER